VLKPQWCLNPGLYGSQKCFPINEIGRIDGGRGFQTKKNVFRIGGNTFYNPKNNFPKKIPESKRSEIGRITEFRGIPNRFPNLGWRQKKNSKFQGVPVPKKNLFKIGD
jgi:hypothetical protein